MSECCGAQECLASRAMRLSKLFAATVGLSIALSTLSLLTALSRPTADEIVPKTAASSVDSVGEPTPVPHCDQIVSRVKPPAARPVSPPWVALLNDTQRNGTRLYIHVKAAQTRRLGNQLFNYASLFGIAYTNNRIPLWPDARTYLRTAFSIRIPIDKGNSIIAVSVKLFHIHTK